VKDPIQPRHEFKIVVESDPPLSESTVLRLLSAGLRLEGTNLRIIAATPPPRVAMALDTDSNLSTN
jgi:hypothetical protein